MVQSEVIIPICIVGLLFVVFYVHPTLAKQLQEATDEDRKMQIRASIVRGYMSILIFILGIIFVLWMEFG
jgi:uncharacterized membrane protein YdbT with pleckstrin-like domain